MSCQKQGILPTITFVTAVIVLIVVVIGAVFNSAKNQPSVPTVELYAPDWSPRVSLVAVDDHDCVKPHYRLRVTVEVSTNQPTRIDTKDLSVEVDGELCSPVFKRKRLIAMQEDPIIYMAISPPLKPKAEHIIRVGYFNSGYTYGWRNPDGTKAAAAGR